MPTRKTAFWFVSAAVLYLIAWNVGSGWLYILVAMLAGLPLASIIISRLNTRLLSVTQESDAFATRGEIINARLSIRNSSILPRFFLRTECSFGGGDTSFLLPFLKSRGNEELTLLFNNAKRGIYSGGDVLIESGAPVGLAVSRRHLVTESPLVVYPQRFDIVGDWGEGWKDSGYMVTSAIPTRHAASDFLGVREYRADDSPRSIHWRTTARCNQLAVIEHAKQSAITPVFIVDTFKESKAGAGPDNSFETVVSMAASLVEREARYNRRFAIGDTPAAVSTHGLEHNPGPAMQWLSGVQAKSVHPLDLSSAELPWPEAVPVLLMTSHVRYADIHESEFFHAFPGSIIIMLDGNGFHPDKKAASGFMNEEQLEALADKLEAFGLQFMLVPSLDLVSQCLENL